MAVGTAVVGLVKTVVRSCCLTYHQACVYMNIARAHKHTVFHCASAMHEVYMARWTWNRLRPSAHTKQDSRGENFSPDTADKQRTGTASLFFSPQASYFSLQPSLEHSCWLGARQVRTSHPRCTQNMPSLMWCGEAPKLIQLFTHHFYARD